MLDIEKVREYALSIDPAVTEDLFAENWISLRIQGKWFLLIQLDAPQPRVAVKLDPSHAIELRELYEGIRPAYHMNKKHWNDLYLELLKDKLVKELILESFFLVSKRKKL